MDNNNRNNAPMDENNAPVDENDTPPDGYPSFKQGAYDMPLNGYLPITEGAYGTGQDLTGRFMPATVMQPPFFMDPSLDWTIPQPDAASGSPGWPPFQHPSLPSVAADGSTMYPPGRWNPYPADENITAGSSVPCFGTPGQNASQWDPCLSQGLLTDGGTLSTPASTGMPGSRTTPDAWNSTMPIAPSVLVQDPAVYDSCPTSNRSKSVQSAAIEVPDSSVQPDEHAPTDSTKGRQTKLSMYCCSHAGCSEEFHLSQTHERHVEIQHPPPNKARQADKYICGYDGCSKSFTRNQTLQRHVRGKHTREVFYDCPILTCKLRGKRATARLDKLGQHLRDGHQEVTSWPCPRHGCDMHLDNLPLLLVHLRSHQPVQGDVLDAVSSAVRLERNTCPIYGCHRLINGRTRLHTHLLSHPEEQRRSFAREIATLGYFWKECTSICPICSDPIANPTVGKERTAKACERLTILHIAEHILIDGEHLDKFTHGAYSWVNPWEWMNSHGTTCPGCNFFFDCGLAKEAHVRATLLDPKEVFSIREKILQLDPGFADHPVFDDIRPREWLEKREWYEKRELRTLDSS